MQKKKKKTGSGLGVSICWHSCLSAGIPVCLLAFLSVCWHSCLSVGISVCWHSCLSAGIPVCLLAFLCIRQKAWSLQLSPPSSPSHENFAIAVSVEVSPLARFDRVEHHGLGDDGEGVLGSGILCHITSFPCIYIKLYISRVPDQNGVSQA